MEMDFSEVSITFRKLLDFAASTTRIIGASLSFVLLSIIHVLVFLAGTFVNGWPFTVGLYLNLGQGICTDIYSFLFLQFYV